MTAGPQNSIAKILADINLVVQYGITISITICKYEILVVFNLVVAKMDHHTAKFNSPPNFPAIWSMCYNVMIVLATCMLYPTVNLEIFIVKVFS